MNPALPADMARPSNSRTLTLAIAISLGLHAVLLSLHFKLPEAISKASERALDVILVNSRSARKPSDAQARAQANLDGGGNTEQNRIASTPLPPSHNTQDGDSLVNAQRRVAELENIQRQLMTQAKSKKTVSNERSTRDPQPQAVQPLSGADLASSAMAIARLEGQISQNVDAYNKMPRKKFIGARTEELRYAQYIEDWRQKVERIGNLNYPEAARGRLYGNLVLTLTVRSDGTLSNVELIRSSGHKELDEAAQRIVRMAAPYAVFPESIRREYDELVITRTWSFTNSDHLQTK
ncbi:MAG TPA: TonB family protein [Rhodocyclaceae bacterium]|jgi:protein TonB|nr:TonB family protein [Rhodocyclaceae bacterium]